VLRIQKDLDPRTAQIMRECILYLQGLNPGQFNNTQDIRIAHHVVRTVLLDKRMFIWITEGRDLPTEIVSCADIAEDHAFPVLQLCIGIKNKHVGLQALREAFEARAKLPISFEDSFERTPFAVGDCIEVKSGDFILFHFQEGV